MIKTISSSPPPLHPSPAAGPPQKGAFSRYGWLYLVMIPVGMLLGLLAGITAVSLVPKKYEAAAIYQMPSGPGDPGNLGMVSTATWIEATRSEKGMREVAAHLDLQHRWKVDGDEVARTLRSILSVDHVRGTSLIRIRVRFTNAQDAADIANTTMQVLRDRIHGEKILIHEMAQASPISVAPNTTLLILLGTGAGFFLSPLLATILILWLGRKRRSGGGLR